MQPMSPLSWEQATSSLKVVVKGKGASRVFGSLTGFHFALLKSPHSSQCPRLFLFLSLSLFFSSYFCSFLSSCIYLSSFILAVEDKRRWFRSSKLANECHSNASPSPPPPRPHNFWLDQLWRRNNTHSTKLYECWIVLIRTFLLQPSLYYKLENL